MKPTRRSTPAGQHRPVMLEEILKILDPQPGQVVVDCTAGWAGHSAALLERVGSEGKLIALDLDADNLPQARQRLEAVGHPFHLVHANFAGLAGVLGPLGVERVHGLVADLGMSSMQVDDPERGFSYRRDGALDMRMDRSRGRTVAQMLQSMGEKELAQALRELGDEPHAELIAAAIVRSAGSLERTSDLVKLIQETTGQGDWQLHPSAGQWNLHPAARTFQALRILVNREMGNLGNLLRVLPEILASQGKAALISFHSGEDRQVKHAFREGRQRGHYDEGGGDPIRASFAERNDNPRARSAKLRWVRRGALQHQPDA